MKKFLILLSALFFLLACGTGSDNAKGEKDQPAVHEHDEAAGGLTLDNGRKWKTDSATRENISNLQTLAEQFANAPDKNLDRYKTLAGTMQEGLDKLVKECTMKGPEHDALHHWLEPFIRSVGELKKVGDATAGEDKFREIDESLGKYSQYFE